MKNYLQDLLYFKDTVIIPGFGGFVTKEISAGIDQVQGRITPPSRRIEFNPYLTNNDDVLVEYLMYKNNWTQAFTVQYIKQEVEKINEMLINNEMVEFQNVGRLFLNFSGRYQFLQSSTNFNQNAFGLPVLEFFPVARNLNIEEKEAPKPMPSLTLFDIKEHSIHKSPSLVVKTKSVLRSYKPWLKQNTPYVAAAYILVIAGTLFLYKDSGRNVETGLNPFSPRPVSERVNTKPSHHIEENESTATLSLFPSNPHQGHNMVIIEEKTVTDDGLIKNTPLDTEVAKYAPSSKKTIVIVGTFGVAKNASRMIKKIYKLGYEPYTKKEGKLTKVGIIKTYDNINQVKQIHRQVSKDFEVKAWLMQPKIK